MIRGSTPTGWIGLAASLGLVAGACLTTSGKPCESDRNCVAGERCVAGLCAADLAGDEFPDTGEAEADPSDPDLDPDASHDMGGGIECPVADDWPETVKASRVSLGEDFSCALLVDGRLKCWGRNEYGQLGVGGTQGFGGHPGSMLGLPAVQAGSGVGGSGTVYFRRVVTGREHACARRDPFKLTPVASGVVCWGSNKLGQLGLGDPTDAYGDGPNEMLALDEIDLGTINGLPARATELAAGAGFSCALLAHGRVKCWGDNQSGQLGQDRADNTIGAAPGDMADALADTLLPAGQVLAITAGDSHACALISTSNEVDPSSGQVYCWGANHAGQLGNGTTTPIGATPGSMATIAAVELGDGAGQVDAIAVVAGGNHSCAVLEDHRVKCWGFGGYGALGHGELFNLGGNPSDFPLAHVDLGGLRVADGLPPASVLAAGHDHSCALLEGGAVVCWGANETGQLGLGDSMRREDPSSGAVDLGPGITAIEVAAGRRHSCARLADSSGVSDERVKCWGGNFKGELGLDDTAHRGISQCDMGRRLPFTLLFPE